MEQNIEKHNFIRRFGERILELRTEKNLSYRKLAQRCDVDYSDISKIEKGQVNIQLTTVHELAKGLGVHPKELLHFEVPLDE